MSDEVFQRYTAYYDLLYGDKDYAAESDYVARILHATAPEARNLLEFGSGTGKHGRLLAKQDYHVYGVERSEFMVDAAGRDHRSITGCDKGSFDCVSGDIRTIELNRTFDAVIALFHVVSYQTSIGDVLNTFASAARHLANGGVFFFDVWHGPAVLTERPSVRVKRVENENVRLTRIAEPHLDCQANTVTVRYTIFAESKADRRLTTFEEEHRMRYFFPTEIDLLSRQMGFRVDRSEAFLTADPPGDKTWGVGYVLRKTAG